MTDEPRKIIKRDGREVDFDKDKIYKAIKKASDEDPSNALTHSSLRMLTDAVVYVADTVSKNTGKPPTVEGVQDIVEKTLIKHGLADLAKKYILYRSEHARIREAKDFLMETFHELTYKDASDVDIKRENANIDADTAMGTMLKYGSTAANFFVDNYILPKDISDAHRYGDIHM